MLIPSIKKFERSSRAQKPSLVAITILVRVKSGPDCTTPRVYHQNILPDHWYCEMIKMLITFLILLRFQFFFRHLYGGHSPKVSKTIKIALGKDLTISISLRFFNASSEFPGWI